MVFDRRWRVTPSRHSLPPAARGSPGRAELRAGRAGSTRRWAASRRRPHAMAPKRRPVCTAALERSGASALAATNLPACARCPFDALITGWPVRCPPPACRVAPSVRAGASVGQAAVAARGRPPNSTRALGDPSRRAEQRVGPRNRRARAGPDARRQLRGVASACARTTGGAARRRGVEVTADGVPETTYTGAADAPRTSATLRSLSGTTMGVSSAPVGCSD